MTDPAAAHLAADLIRRYRTRDPFLIAENLGIEVMKRAFSKQKGAFRVILGVKFIFINENLSEEMQTLVCAHELGHALLHPQYGENEFLAEFEIFDLRSSTEYDANVFAACLLIDREEMMENFRDGMDVVQNARALNTNANVLLLLLNEMNRGGEKFSLPMRAKSTFLGDIGDNADY